MSYSMELTAITMKWDFAFVYCVLASILGGFASFISHILWGCLAGTGAIIYACASEITFKNTGKHGSAMSILFGIRYKCLNIQPSNIAAFSKLTYWYQTPPGSVSISDKTSYRNISQSLEGERFECRTVQALLPMCLSNFEAMWWFKLPISRLRDFTRSYDKTSYWILKRGPVLSTVIHYSNVTWGSWCLKSHGWTCCNGNERAKRAV